jgi:hypothetical protein
MSWRKRPFFVRKPGCSVAFTRPRHRSGDPNDCRRCLHLFVVFPARRRNYLAAVIGAGFSGIILGATPTAICEHDRGFKGASAAPTACIILPLVSDFFIDIANTTAIGFLSGDIH